MAFSDAKYNPQAFLLHDIGKTVAVQNERMPPNTEARSCEFYQTLLLVKPPYTKHHDETI